MKKKSVKRISKLIVLTVLTFVINFSVRAQMITTYAGNGSSGWTVPGLISSNTKFELIDALAFDPTGNLYVSTSENKIFQISTGGVISVFAGTGLFPNSGDGGQATSAGIGRPRKIIFDAVGNCYFSTPTNHTIRKINTAGIISTIAGTGAAGYTGDGGLATAAQIAYPEWFRFDSSGNLFLVCGDNVNTQGSRVRRIDNATGIITTIAGTGVVGDNGNGGMATSAEIAAISLAIDPNDNIYIYPIFIMEE